MKTKNSNILSLRNRELEVRLEVKPICTSHDLEIRDCESCKEKAQIETRKLMDDIWKRYPMAEVSRVNFDSNSVVFEL
jgi:hypothetical protein